MSEFNITLNPELIRYNQSAMNQAVDEITRTSNDYRGTFESLDVELQKSLAQWEAGPKELYIQVKHKWDQQADDRATKLAGLGPKLTQIDEIYQRTHQGVTQTWS